MLRTAAPLPVAERRTRLKLHLPGAGRAGLINDPGRAPELCQRLGHLGVQAQATRQQCWKRQARRKSLLTTGRQDLFTGHAEVRQSHKKNNSNFNTAHP